jgi:hypothetical protein
MLVTVPINKDASPGKSAQEPGGTPTRESVVWQKVAPPSDLLFLDPKACVEELAKILPWPWEEKARELHNKGRQATSLPKNQKDDIAYTFPNANNQYFQKSGWKILISVKLWQIMLRKQDEWIASTVRSAWGWEVQEWLLKVEPCLTMTLSLV